MSKRTRRPARSNRDIHQAIRDAAIEVRSMPEEGFAPVASVELADLLRAALQAVESAAPSTLEHHGKTYRIRTQLAKLHILVFDSVETATPLVTGRAFSTCWTGHAPGH